MSILPIIIEQHVEEAAFNWLLRNNAVSEPHFELQDLADLDERVDAHLDGARRAGDEGWDLCLKILPLAEAEEVFASAVLAFGHGNNNRLQTVLDIATEDSERIRGLISALGWLDWTHVEEHIPMLAGSKSFGLRRIGLSAFVMHRRNPGRLLVESLADDDPLLRARALKAVGELGFQDLLVQIQDGMRDENYKCRYYAAKSNVLTGNNEALSILQDIAESESEYAEKACAMALRVMKLSDCHDWLREMSQQESRVRFALQGAGVVGDPVSIPWLVEMMQVPVFARGAGEAFTMITGVDLADEGLEQEWPEGFEAGPTEEPQDEDVEMDADEDLPWPNSELVANWWNERQDEFQAGTRYLVGKPISAAHLQQVLRTGYQRQRATAALELAILQPKAPLFDVRAPGFRQQKILGLK